MARITLHREEADGELPAVCIVSGVAATLRMKHIFRIAPWGSGGPLLHAAQIPLAVMMGTSCEVELPLAEEMRSRIVFFKLLRTGIPIAFGVMLLFLFAAAVGMLVGYVSTLLSPDMMMFTTPACGCACSLLFLGLLLSAGGYVALQRTISGPSLPYPSEITAQQITLENVHPKFAEAVLLRRGPSMPT